MSYGIVKGLAADKYIPGPVKIISLTISASGVGAVFHVHDGQNLTSDPIIDFLGAGAWTEQLSWKGIYFHSGFVAQPVSGVTSYLIEYETIEPGNGYQ